MAALVNPVLARELKERVRGWKAPAIITTYLVMLGAVVYLVYEAEKSGATNSFGFSAAAATRSSLIGRGIFEWMVFFMILLVMFIVPGLTASAVAGERERQTLVPLQVTLLKPRSIILGKISSALAFIFLLIIAAMPLLSVAFLIGGITIGDVFKAVGVVLATAVIMACLSMACSSLTKRVQTATVLSYAVALLLIGGSTLAYGVAYAIDESRGFDAANPPEELLIGNPMAAVADLVGTNANRFGERPSSPFNGIRDWLDPNPFANSFDGGFNPGFEEPARAIAPDGRIIDGGNFNEQFFADEFADRVDDGDQPFWLKSLVALGTLSVLAVVISARRIRTPGTVER